MSERIAETPLAPVRVVFILDEDRAASAALREELAQLGYQAQAFDDASEALNALRACDEGAVLFFDVEAYGATLDGRGFASLIGDLLREPALARLHNFAVISSTPDEVEQTLGKALARLRAPIFGKPCVGSGVEAYLALAVGHHPWQPAPEIAATW